MVTEPTPRVAFYPSPCPFCGLAADVPHETQEGCIEALQAEISRVRGILNHLHPLSALTAGRGPEDRSA
jgi:hypothetical protein